MTKIIQTSKIKIASIIYQIIRFHCFKNVNCGFRRRAIKENLLIHFKVCKCVRMKFQSMIMIMI